MIGPGEKRHDRVTLMAGVVIFLVVLTAIVAGAVGGVGYVVWLAAT